MSGFTKYIYDKDIQDILNMWNVQLKVISQILPIKYNKDIIINLLKKYYPYEWQGVEYKYLYYTKKDEYIQKLKYEKRYNMLHPLVLIEKCNHYKKIQSSEYKIKWKEKYSEISVKAFEERLIKERIPKIKKIEKKINTALKKTELVTPQFIDELIGYYSRENTTQKDRLYILLELQKYFNSTVINFFFKINDCELNKQLRMQAFKHLQSFNFPIRLRRQKYMIVHSSNKKRKEYLKKIYPNERYEIPMSPVELQYRLENSFEQNVKNYDYFISHSYLDKEEVQKLIIYENKKGKNIFCDWINDVDYLKRNLLCEATLKVIEKRLEQSKALIFVKSSNSLNSKWCNYELNYFYNLNKPIYIINKENINNGSYEKEYLVDAWFKDEDYKKIINL